MGLMIGACVNEDEISGEIFGGQYSGPDGKPVRFWILPGDNAPADWKEQMAWAKSIGGDLPNRIEQSLLFAFLKQEFRPAPYWSNELESDGWAWYQGFSYGDQYYLGSSSELRARAVRRLAI